MLTVLEFGSQLAFAQFEKVKIECSSICTGSGFVKWAYCLRGPISVYLKNTQTCLFFLNTHPIYLRVSFF